VFKNLLPDPKSSPINIDPSNIMTVQDFSSPRVGPATHSDGGTVDDFDDEDESSSDSGSDETASSDASDDSDYEPGDEDGDDDDSDYEPEEEDGDDEAGDSDDESESSAYETAEDKDWNTPSPPRSRSGKRGPDNTGDAGTDPKRRSL